jgi:hypothetical protein
MRFEKSRKGLMKMILIRGWLMKSNTRLRHGKALRRSAPTTRDLQPNENENENEDGKRLDLQSGPALVTK